MVVHLLRGRLEPGPAGEPEVKGGRHLRHGRRRLMEPASSRTVSARAQGDVLAELAGRAVDEREDRDAVVWPTRRTDSLPTDRSGASTKSSPARSR